MVTEEKHTHMQPTRRREMDLLGMVIVVGLVFFHSAQIFAGTGFDVENTQQGMVAGIAANLLLAFASMWGMPLMMLIAGTAIWWSLRKRTVGQFLLNRVQRLLIPFVTGMALILPPRVWFRQKFHQASYSESYGQFLRRFFNIRFSLSAFPGFIVGAAPDRLWTTGHLWFLIFLFVYTLLLLPLFWVLRQPSGQRLVGRRAGFLARSWAIFLLALPIGLIEALLMTEQSGVWNRFVWPFFLVYGFLLASEPEFGRALQRHRRSALVLGIVAFLLYFTATGYLLMALGADGWTDYSAVGLLARFFKGLGGWFWLVTIMGLAGQMARRGAREDQAAPAPTENPGPLAPETPGGPSWMDRLADYAKEAQLPFYVLHHTPIVVIGYYVVRWQANPLVKYVVIVLGVLLTTVVVYDTAVRRTPPTRFLFGLRPAKTQR
jgi:hypothetical protein